MSNELMSLTEFTQNLFKHAFLLLPWFARNFQERTFEIDALEKSTGVHRSILRQTLMILLGDGVIEGEFQDNVFELKQKQNTKDFVRRLQNELMMHIN